MKTIFWELESGIKKCSITETKSPQAHTLARTHPRTLTHARTHTHNMYIPNKQQFLFCFFFGKIYNSFVV